MKLTNTQMETLWWKYKAEGIAKNLSLQAFCSIASCIIRSMVETCKLWGKSVYEYMRAYFTAVAAGRTDCDNLMPWSIEMGC